MSRIPTTDGTNHLSHAHRRVRRGGVVGRVVRGLVALCVAVAGLALAPPAVASAQSVVLVSNFAETAAAGGESVAADDLVAVSFTTGANPSGYWLTQVTLSTSTAGSAVVTAAIYDDSSGAPGTSQATLTRPGGIGHFSAAGVELAASTTYWVVIDKDTAGTLAVGFTESEDQTGETGWEIGDAFQKKTGTGSWTETPTGKTLRLAVRGEARPLVLVSNAAETPTASLYTLGADDLVAVSFRTGANPSGYNLSSVGVPVSVAGSAVPAVAIYDDSSGSPGTSQATLTNPASFPTATTEDQFTAADVDLAANTTYWVVIDKGTAGTLRMRRSASDDQTGETRWSIGDAYQEKTGTGSWTADSLGRTLLISVRGTPINVAPQFAADTVTRSVRENTYLGATGVSRTVNTYAGHVGEAVTATDADRDALTYSVAATSDSDAAAHLAAFNEDFTLNPKTGSGDHQR